MRIIDGLRRLATRHPIYMISIPLVIGLGVQALIKTDPEWIDVYVAAGRALLRGDDIYAAGANYLYPPFAALLAVPFAPLPDLAIRLVWCLINVVAIVWLARSAWGLAGGSRIDFTDATDRREWLVLALGAVCSVPYALNALAHQQTDLLLGALVLTGCSILLEGRLVIGAMLIGLGAAFKGPPLLFAAYFAFRGNWRAAGLVAAVAIGVNLLPDLVASPDAGTWLGRWITRLVVLMAQIDTTLGIWGTELVYNQSLAGTVQRLASTTLVAAPEGLDAIGRHASIDNRTLKALTYGTMLGMLAISIWAAIWAARRGGRGRTALEDSLPAGLPGAGLPDAAAIEFSIVVTLMLLMSPMSGLAHFAVLALPSLCLARLAVFRHRGSAIAAVAVAAIGAVAINKDLVGGFIYDAMLWGGGTTVSAIALWLGCVAALAKGDIAPAPTWLAGSLFGRLARADVK